MRHWLLLCCVLLLCRSTAAAALPGAGNRSGYGNLNGVVLGGNLFAVTGESFNLKSAWRGYAGWPRLGWAMPAGSVPSLRLEVTSERAAGAFRFSTPGVHLRITTVASNFVDMGQFDSTPGLLPPEEWTGFVVDMIDWVATWAPEFGVCRIGCPPPEKNELVLSIETGCAATVPLPREPNTPF